MWRHNDVIGRNEYLISTLSESTVPYVYSLQFLFKSTHHSWRYGRKCEWVFFSEHSVLTIRRSTGTIDELRIICHALLSRVTLASAGLSCLATAWLLYLLRKYVIICSYRLPGLVLGLVRRFRCAFALIKVVFIGFNVIKTMQPPFLADRTNGRAIATLLRLSSSVCRLWRYVLWLNGAS